MCYTLTASRPARAGSKFRPETVSSSSSTSSSSSAPKPASTQREGRRQFTLFLHTLSALPISFIPLFSLPSPRAFTFPSLPLPPLSLPKSSLGICGNSSNGNVSRNGDPTVRLLMPQRSCCAALDVDIISAAARARVSMRQL